MPMCENAPNAPQISERDIAVEIGKRWQLSNNPRVEIEKLAARKIERLNNSVNE